MTKLFKTLLVNLLAVSTLSFSLDNMASNGEIPSIEVKGQGSVFVKPDQFSLTMAIREQGRHKDEIRSTVDHKSNQVVQVAKSLGIKSHDINSAKVTLRVVEEKPAIIVDNRDVNQRAGNNSFSKNQYSKVYGAANSNKNQITTKPQLFELGRTIKVNFSRIDDYDLFLSKVIKLGVSHIYPLVMSIGNTEKHYQQALVLAINNAKNKASKIANTANVKLGNLFSVKEQSSNYYRSQMSSMRMSAEKSVNHESQVTNQVIKASVVVKYIIQE